MHGWDRDANGDRDVLGRIVALLFALAGLADLAAGLPFLRRREVLGFLAYGEAAVRPWFAGMALGALSEEDAFHGDAPADCRDASQLAARFRALAFMLAALLTLADPSAPPRAAAPFAGGREPARPARWPLAIPVRRGDLPPCGGDARQGRGGRCPAGLAAMNGQQCQDLADNLAPPGSRSRAPIQPVSRALPFAPAHNMYTLEQSPHFRRAAAAEP